MLGKHPTTEPHPSTFSINFHSKTGSHQATDPPAPGSLYLGLWTRPTCPATTPHPNEHISGTQIKQSRKAKSHWVSITPEQPSFTCLLQRLGAKYPLRGSPACWQKAGHLHSDTPALERAAKAAEAAPTQQANKTPSSCLSPPDDTSHTWQITHACPWK